MTLTVKLFNGLRVMYADHFQNDDCHSPFVKLTMIGWCITGHMTITNVT